MVTVIILSLMLATCNPLCVTQDCGLIILGVVMVIAAIIDILLVDKYGLLKDEKH